MVNNILIIGNGFDLSHGLPTRYTDFLSLVRNWNTFYDAMPKEQELYKKDYTLPIYRTNIPMPDGKIDIETVKAFSEIDPINYSWYNLEQFDHEVKNNLWIKYFLRNGFQKTNWIDFEKEIEKVILVVKNFYDRLSTLRGETIMGSFDDETQRIIRDFSNNGDGFPKSIHQNISLNDINYSKIARLKNLVINNMKENLDGLIEALRIYFVEFVDKIDAKFTNPAISKIPEANVLSFNYTNYITRYNNIKNVHYIHGNLDYDDFENNMVLGINDDNIQDNDFVYFFKYFQRIQKRTGNQYTKWLSSSDENWMLSKTVVYVFGHSLDSNDKSILSYFLDNPNVDKIVIYYHNQSTYESQVINLINMLGRDFVVENVSNEKIEFYSISECMRSNSAPVFN